MAPSKSDKKAKSGGAGKGAARAATKTPSKAGGKTGARAKDSDGGLKVSSSQGSRGRGKLTAPAKAGNKKAASKARKVAVETSLPVVERPGVAETRALAEAAIEVALDKKALMPVLIDVSAMASYTDFIAILSGKSDRQVDAIAEGITQFMKGKARTIVGHEGNGGGRWTLLDFGDVVFHVFYHPVREFYDLESLWVDAPRVALQVPPEAMRVQPDMMY